MSNIPTSYQGIIASVPANQEVGSLESGSVSTTPAVNQQDYQLHQTTPGGAAQQSQHTTTSQNPQPGLTYRHGSVLSISLFGFLKNILQIGLKEIILSLRSIY